MWFEAEDPDEQRERFAAMIRNVVPHLQAPLLLLAVAPATALLYVEAFGAFLQWAGWSYDFFFHATNVDAVLTA